MQWYGQVCCIHQCHDIMNHHEPVDEGLEPEESRVQMDASVGVWLPPWIVAYLLPVAATLRSILFSSGVLPERRHDAESTLGSIPFSAGALPERGHDAG